jgi:hypothetical protein
VCCIVVTRIFSIRYSGNYLNILSIYHSPYTIVYCTVHAYANSLVCSRYGNSCILVTTHSTIYLACMHTSARQIQNHAVIIEPALNRLMQLGCPIYLAVTLDPVNARALAPVGTDESVCCGDLVWLQNKLFYS